MKSSVARLLLLLLLIGTTGNVFGYTNTTVTVTYIHTDALGSVVAESDTSGNVIQRYHYAL